VLLATVIPGGLTAGKTPPFKVSRYSRKDEVMPEENVLIQPAPVVSMTTAFSGTQTYLHLRKATKQKRAVDRRSGPDREDGQPRTHSRSDR
jgi:hypothetical protein